MPVRRKPRRYIDPVQRQRNRNEMVVRRLKEQEKLMARPLGELYKRKVDNHPVRAYQWKIDDNDLSGTWAIIDELVKQGREILCTEDEIRKDRLFWQMTSVDGIDWHEDDWVLWDGAQLFMIPNQFFDRDYEKVG